MRPAFVVITFASLSAGCASSPDDALPLGADAASCGSCHASHYDAWARSSHGTSAESPIFRAMLPEVEAAWGTAARDACESCHAPEHAPGEEAIGCVSCHAAVGNHEPRDGALVVDLSRGIAGPLDDPAPTLAHRPRDGGLLGDSSLCGTCHELTGPNGVLEPTFTEFLASPQAQEGATCADCHLPDESPGPLAIGASRSRPRRSHRFIGFDPPWGARPEAARSAAARTRELLASALTLRVLAAEDGVTIVVENVGAAHAVPTGATLLRDLWVDVETAEGIRPRVLVLGDRAMRGSTPVGLITEADRIEVGTLAAGAQRSVFVPTESPVTAHLRGRAVRSSVLEALGRHDLETEIPTHQIHLASGSPR